MSICSHEQPRSWPSGPNDDLSTANDPRSVLIDDPVVLERLVRLIHSLSADWDLCEDLRQEALIHLWQQESQCPDHTQSWYLQSCRFHLQHYLNRGRSLDSVKRRAERCGMEDGFDEAEFLDGQQSPDESLLGSVCAHDLLELLLGQVKPSDRVILNHLAEGLGAREIAQKLRVSHQAVSKHRRNIAAMAIQLGISPPPKTRSASTH